MKKTTLLAILIVALSAVRALVAADATNPLLANWALTIPGGGAGWLGVEQKDGTLKASLLWGGGSVTPVNDVKIEGDKLIVTRIHKTEKKNPDGKVIKSTVTETITATASGDDLKLVTVKRDKAGKESGRAEFTGKRTPPPPPAPDLAKLKFGDPIQLFNGKDLTGWSLINPKADNGWSVADGVLINRVAKGKHCGNIRTDREFEDFNLTLEVRTQEKSNSGIYLRGIYEVQIAETYGKPVDSHNMGAIYSRITPSVAAEKPIGEWQTLDITLVNRHATVILNGKKIIDNKPLLGCTGGALWSDQCKPGPIYLQGDHTNIDYRNIVLRPVVK
jgi:hypothetical protein